MSETLKQVIGGCAGIAVGVSLLFLYWLFLKIKFYFYRKRMAAEFLEEFATFPSMGVTRTVTGDEFSKICMTCGRFSEMKPDCQNARSRATANKIKITECGSWGI